LAERHVELLLLGDAGPDRTQALDIAGFTRLLAAQECGASALGGQATRRRKNDARWPIHSSLLRGSNELTCDAGQSWLQPVS